jgi:YHS domain-containing protein
MFCRYKSDTALVTAILLVAFSVGCKSGGQSATLYPSAASQNVPVPPTDLIQQAASRSTAVTPVSTQLLREAGATANPRPQFCPVTGAKLGSMGAPVPVSIDGRTIYVCCAGCVEKLKQNPQKHLRPAGSSGGEEASRERSASQYASGQRSGSSCGSSSGACGSGGCH